MKTKECPPAIQRAIQDLLGYDWEREEEHFGECCSENGGEMPKDHIFESMCKVSKWLHPQGHLSGYTVKEYLEEIRDYACGANNQYNFEP